MLDAARRTPEWGCRHPYRYRRGALVHRAPDSGSRESGCGRSFRRTSAPERRSRCEVRAAPGGGPRRRRSAAGPRADGVRWLRISAVLLAVGVAVWLPLRSLGTQSRAASPGHRGDLEPRVWHRPEAAGRWRPAKLGFHTNQAPNQNVTIDLGSVRRISRIVVYNRSDCCQERAVPLTLELSKDGKAFQVIEERHEPFDRWKVELPDTRRATCVCRTSGTTTSTCPRWSVY